MTYFYNTKKKLRKSYAGLRISLKMYLVFSLFRSFYNYTSVAFDVRETFEKCKQYTHKQYKNKHFRDPSHLSRAFLDIDRHRVMTSFIHFSTIRRTSYNLARRFSKKPILYFFYSSGDCTRPSLSRAGETQHSGDTRHLKYVCIQTGLYSASAKVNKHFDPRHRPAWLSTFAIIEHYDWSLEFRVFHSPR